MIYLYAITEATAPVPSEAGFEEVPLQLARTGDVAALYSFHGSDPTQPQPDALLRHEHVVEAAMRHGPTLPARFGTTFADDDALRLAVEGEHDRLQRQLAAVRGCVELAVRVGLPRGKNRRPGDGREYLEAKLAERSELERVTRDTLRPLQELAVKSRCAASTTEENVLRASYLVRAELVQRFADEVKLLADRNREVWLSCTGPWPPYSFVDLEETA